ncbi:MAG TPA: ABC transporter ATP-binding protein [Acidimicrobiales bacterium]|nr:ABC transporter ATP-binding protein [Acidimicrobiales bacterium]
MTRGEGPPGGAAAVEIVDAWHRYGSQEVLSGVDLDVERGRFVAVLGASGSGKTTLLRLVAGFERLASGVISIGGTVVDDGRRWFPPEKRKVGYVPQDAALFPHMKVAANVAFGLKRGVARRRVPELLELVGLAGLEDRYPHQLSGGQQQRVALARALAVEPGVVLLDEPFSALDAAMRASLRDEVAAILRRGPTTTILVTHDQDEALSLADRVAVLRGGRIVAEGRPEDLYRRPADPEMATFLGDANLLPGRPAGAAVDTALGRLVLLDGAASAWGAPPQELVVLVRPEQLELRSRSAAPASGGIPARVVGASYFGHDAVLQVAPERQEQGGAPLLARVTGVAPPPLGAEVLVTVRGPVMAWPAPAGELRR